MSYSSIIRESEDFGAALVDAEGRGLAESAQSTPLQSGPIPGYVRGVLRILKERGDQFRPGDVVMPPGSPFTVGFRALFEGAVFELQQIFRDGPPEIAFTIAEGRAAPQPVDLAGGNPYEIELRRFVDCIAGRADPALLDADRAVEALELSLAVRRALGR